MVTIWVASVTRIVPCMITKYGVHRKWDKSGMKLYYVVTGIVTSMISVVKSVVTGIRTSMMISMVKCSG